MVLDERDLVRPPHARYLPRPTRISLLGAPGVLKHHQCQIKAHRFHRA